MSKLSFADEQQARLNAIGLDCEESIAANENAPSRLGLYHQLGRDVPSTDRMRSPGRLTKEQVAEHANADGWVDAKLGRPMSIAPRFVEANLYLENMDRFGLYAETYERAWKAGAK